MAKDLPYFKFFCSEWNDGDITLESYEAQGVFINICSYYWSNECNVNFDKLLKRFRGCEDIINDLNAEGLFKINEDRLVCISFLDQQKEEREERSKIRSKGGKASAEAKRIKKLELENNTNSTSVQHVLNSSSTQVQLLREEKRREEEKREDKKQSKIDFSKLLISYNTIYSKKTRVINTAVKTKYNKLLKEGYTKTDIHQAMLNAKQDDFHKECKLKHLTLEYFSRAKTMDLYAFLTTKQISKPIETENPYQKENPDFFKGK